jgi:hypothetical protein
MRQLQSFARQRVQAFAIALSLAWPATAAFAQTADTVLFNGKIVTVDKDFSVQQALAIGNGRIVATGTSAAMKKLAGDSAKLVDLGGRTVIPGLTDGHIHGIRAALTFGTEVNWIGVPTLKEALEKIRAAAKTQKPGSWIVVAGGWTEEQFAEKRRPTSQHWRPIIPSTSSTSTTGCCFRRKPWRRSIFATMPMSRPAASSPATATDRPA